MKRLLLLLLAFGALTCSAQFPHNGGFEDSVMVSNGYIPSNWSVDGFGFGYSNDAHSGSKAAQIWNWYYYARGWVVNGVSITGYDGSGMPVTANPSVLNGWYKYEYGENQGAADSAVVEVLVSNANYDTLAYSTMRLGPASTYTQFSLPITYLVIGEMADSARIRFQSSVAGFCSNASNGTCLYLTVDDLQMETITGVAATMDFEPKVSLAPNPSNGELRIVDGGNDIYPCTLEILDLMGRLVFSESLQPTNDSAIRTGLPPGNYAWRTISANGSMESGKIILR